MCPESFVRTVQTQFGKMESKSLLQQAATRQHRFQRGHEAYRSRSKLITTLRRPRAAFTMPPLENLQNTTVNTSLEILQDWQQAAKRIEVDLPRAPRLCGDKDRHDCVSLPNLRQFIPKSIENTPWKLPLDLEHLEPHWGSHAISHAWEIVRRSVFEAFDEILKNVPASFKTG